MLEITDLFDLNRFVAMVGDDLVHLSEHPDNPDVLIANYTKKAQSDYVWNEVTTQCRGLIYNSQTGEVIARSFPKFFNFDEPNAPSVPLDTPIRAFDKLDGSLGILYCLDGKWRVATRGSFTSTQAVKATEMLKKYAFHVVDGATMVVEIIYPDNRIVVDYGDAEELVYLGHVDNSTGHFVYMPERWSGERSKLLYQGELRGLFNHPERKNAEGFVVHTPFGEMVKVKYDEYIQLHRIVTKLSKRTVWDYMDGPDGSVKGLISQLPEEHANWVLDVCSELKSSYAALDCSVRAVYDRVRTLPSRKEQAIELQDEPPEIRAAVFLALDGKKYVDLLWKKLRPRGDY